MTADYSDITSAVIDLDDDLTVKLVKEKLAGNAEPQDVLNALTKGMNEVGRKYTEKEYFLSDLVMAGEVFKQAMVEIQPRLAADDTKKCGTVVIGTVQGDLHDIGKNIMAALLQNNGFQVIDLGVDVPPAKFIETVMSNHADILAMSGILTLAADPMRETVGILKEKGLRDKVKVIIGGLPIDEMWVKEVGADAGTDDAFAGLNTIKKFLGVN